jgi:hypothetical protein
MQSETRNFRHPRTPKTHKSCNKTGLGWPLREETQVPTLRPPKIHPRHWEPRSKLSTPLHMHIQQETQVSPFGYPSRPLTAPPRPFEEPRVPLGPFSRQQHPVRAAGAPWWTRALVQGGAESEPRRAGTSVLRGRKDARGLLSLKSVKSLERKGLGRRNRTHRAGRTVGPRPPRAPTHGRTWKNGVHRGEPGEPRNIPIGPRPTNEARRG